MFIAEAFELHEKLISMLLTGSSNRWIPSRGVWRRKFGIRTVSTCVSLSHGSIQLETGLTSYIKFLIPALRISMYYAGSLICVSLGLLLHVRLITTRSILQKV